MLGGVYTGTHVAGVSNDLADVWRTLNFALAFVLLAYWSGMISSTVRREGRMPRFSAWGMGALSVFTLRAVIAQAERWNTPLVWEGAPSLSLALGLGLANAIAMRRAMDRLRAGEAVSRATLGSATRPERHGASDDFQRPVRGSDGG